MRVDEVCRCTSLNLGLLKFKARCLLTHRHVRHLLRSPARVVVEQMYIRGV